MEFLRRFAQHVLPKGLQKIRHYGLYAAAANESLNEARAALHSTPTPETRANIERLRDWQQALKELTGRDVRLCSNCGGPIEHQPLPAQARAPPEARRVA